MKPATIQDIKEELSNLPPPKVLELTLRLARYKKENKELLTYLLFEAHDEDGFIRNAKQEIEDLFAEIQGSNAYLIKKSLRRILKIVTRYSKHTASKQAELEMLIHFCKAVKKMKFPIRKSPALANIYDRQIKKIGQLLPSIHSDLQYDYKKEIDLL